MRGLYKVFMVSSSKLHNLHRYVNSGCMQHMTNQRSWFKTYQPIESISGIKTRARRLGDILVRTKKGDNYEMNVLIDVLHVPNLGRSLFSCYKTTQKNIFTLHMKDGSQLIQEGNVVMTKVTKDKMY